MDKPTLAGIEDALANIRPYMPETPLVRAEMLSRAFDADVWVKNETATPIASFKLRGALNGMIRAKARGGLTGVCTHSTGNHGQGIAYAGRALGVPTAIFLPENPNPVKAAMIEAFGGELHAVGKDLGETENACENYAEEKGYLFVSDGDNVDMMEGAGTLGLEVGRTLESIDTAFVPVGGANLVSGTAAALKALHPNVRVIGVQAKGSPATVDSYLAGKPVERPMNTIAEGLLCHRPPEFALSCMIEFVDDAVLASDEELIAAVHTVIECAHVLVEPSGAASLAAAWQRRDELRGQNIMLVFSGANITTDMLQRALNTPPLFAIDSVS